MADHRHVKGETAVGESSIGAACACRYIPDVPASSFAENGGLD